MTTKLQKLTERVEALEAQNETWKFKDYLFKTQIRDLLLSHIHAITQSGYKLEFYDNGSLKSIAPKGKEE